VLLKNHAWSRQQNAPSLALKETHSKRGFQVAHLLRDAWLRNTQAIGRAAKATGLSNSQEVAEMPDFERIVHRDKYLLVDPGGQEQQFSVP
jgi:hypothetical protein